jgi:hypothetical protein
MQPKARLIKAEIHYGEPLYFAQEYAKRGDRATLQRIADRIMEEIAALRDRVERGRVEHDRVEAS